MTLRAGHGSTQRGKAATNILEPRINTDSTRINAFRKKLNHDPPFEIVEICKLKKVKFKTPFIKSVLYPCESVAILFFI